MLFFVVAVLAAAVVFAAPLPPKALHGWGTVQEMIFAHGGNDTLASAAEVAFIAATYPWYTFANCYGVPHGKGRGNHTQEAATLASAAALKAANAGTRVVFYWKSDMAEQIIDCSNTSAVWAARGKEWGLKDDSGKPITHGNDAPVFDTTVASFQDFWVGHLVDVAQSTGSDGTALIDGFFIDGCICTSSTAKVFPNINPTRTGKICNATRAMLARAQAEVTALGRGQIVVWNALDSEFGLAQHAGATLGSMVDHFAALQFINEHTGNWDGGAKASLADLIVNVTRSPLNADRMLQFKAWPGPLTHPWTWVNNSQPTTPAGFRAAAADQLNSTLAAFLLAADEQSWLGYSWCALLGYKAHTNHVT
jgi:hypothetical protein